MKREVKALRVTLFLDPARCEILADTSDDLQNPDFRAFGANGVAEDVVDEVCRRLATAYRQRASAVEIEVDAHGQIVPSPIP